MVKTVGQGQATAAIPEISRFGIAPIWGKREGRETFPVDLPTTGLVASLRSRQNHPGVHPTDAKGQLARSSRVPIFVQQKRASDTRRHFDVMGEGRKKGQEGSHEEKETPFFTRAHEISDSGDLTSSRASCKADFRDPLPTSRSTIPGFRALIGVPRKREIEQAAVEDMGKIYYMTSALGGGG